MTDAPSRPVSPAMAGLAGRCPRCGTGKLFEGFLTVRPGCEACGLDYSFADAGDGPAVFVILFAGFAVIIPALIVEFVYQPPFWLHALLWGPLILLATLGPLRLLKGLMIGLQYRNDASEGRVSGRPEQESSQPKPSRPGRPEQESPRPEPSRPGPP